MALLSNTVTGAPHDEDDARDDEDGHGNDEEIDHGLQPLTPKNGDLGLYDLSCGIHLLLIEHVLQLVQAAALRQYSDERVDDQLYKPVDDGIERSTEHHSNGHIDHVALGDELLKIREKAGPLLLDLFLDLLSLFFSDLGFALGHFGLKDLHISLTHSKHPP